MNSHINEFFYYCPLNSSDWNWFFSLLFNYQLTRIRWNNINKLLVFKRNKQKKGPLLFGVHFFLYWIKIWILFGSWFRFNDFSMIFIVQQHIICVCEGWKSVMLTTQKTQFIKGFRFFWKMKTFPYFFINFTNLLTLTLNLWNFRLSNFNNLLFIIMNHDHYCC